MSRHKIDISGKEFGKWTVLYHIKNNYWMCRCACLLETPVRSERLRNGLSKQCDKCHIVSQTIHGHARKRAHSSTFRSWASMVQRCTNPNATRFNIYGGRGITICERWRLFENFLEDMGDRIVGTSLERIENDCGYSKENCYWATPRQQQSNLRSNRWLLVDDKTMHLSDASMVLGINYTTLWHKLRRGGGKTTVIGVNVINVKPRHNQAG